MKMVIAFTTFRRFEFFAMTIQSCADTLDARHSWTIIVADDDGGCRKVLELAKRVFHGWDLHFILSSGRGIHAQTNKILRFCRKLVYDVGFKADNDLIFKKGWDRAYVDAVLSTGYEHLVLHDPKWPRKTRPRELTFDPTGKLQNLAWPDDTQGAFWTFTPRVLDAVGYFDVEKFGLCGFGHRDFSFRCCRAGFNKLETLYDVAGSEYYMQLNQDNYRCSNRYWGVWNTPSLIESKRRLLQQNRVFVPYRVLNCSVMGLPLFRMHL